MSSRGPDLLHQLADGQQSEPASGRVDLLGELIFDQPGAGYYQRGVMTYPRIGIVSIR